MRAQLHETMKRYDEALRDYDLAIKLEPKDKKVSIKTVAHKRRAALLSHGGDHRKAIDELTRAFDTDKADEELLRLRGQEYANLKMYERAIEDYSTAIDMSPEYAATTLEARSRAYEKLGKVDLASKDQAEARRLHNIPAERPIYELKP